MLGGWRKLDPDSEVGYAETLHDGIQDSMTDFYDDSMVWFGNIELDGQASWGFQKMTSLGGRCPQTTTCCSELDLLGTDLDLHGSQDAV